MDLQSLVLDVEAYTRQRLSEYIEELQMLCAIEAHSFHKPGLDEVAIYLAARMRGVGMHVSIIERKQYGNDLLGVMHGPGRGNVLLLGHTDTVYPVGTAAARPVRLVGDALYGPGVCDMKGCILSAIYAIEALLAMGYRSFGEIRCLRVWDGETTHRHCIAL